MSGRRAPHLQRRDGVYHLRVRVPDAIRPTLGRTEVRRSLQTVEYPKARSRVALLAAKVMEAFDMIESSQCTRDQARQLIHECFVERITLAETQVGFIPKTDLPDLEIDEQDHMSRERVIDLRQQLAGNSYDGTIEVLARDFLASRGIAFHELSPARQMDFLSGVARLQIEEQRLYQLRLTNRLGTFTAVDDLFTQGQRATLAAPSTAEPTKGLSIADAIARYLGNGKRQWVAKTYAARVWQLRFFSEHVGPTLPLAAVTEHHIRTFRDGVRMLHKRHGKMKGASFQERQTGSGEHRITDKTASVTFEPIRAFFGWASSVEGLIASNPAEKVRIVAAKQPKGQKPRRNFTADELRTLFTAPIFTGCRSIHRRYEPGTDVIKDAKFWLPVLGCYCGMRLGEIVQLHVRDIHLDGPIPFLSINEDNGPNVGIGDRKHVKSEAGIRQVPLHPDILALGFEKFVASRAKRSGKARVRLFDEFGYGSDEQASTVASKWFARFMDSVGLTDSKLCFHSLRHNAEDAFRDALVPKYVIDRIIGHSDPSASGGYGDGASLEVMHAAVVAMKLKVRVAGLLGCEKG